MASYSLRCLSFFFILTLSLSLQTQARESKFFSKVSHYLTKKNTKSTTSNILSPTISPAPAPTPESVVVEHGYGLYGHETYQYPPTTTDPVKTSAFDTEFTESLPYGNGNGNEKQGMSDTRFLENGKYYYDVNQGAHEDDERENVFVHDGNGNGNGYGTKKEGMGDTRYMDNGKYFYDNNNNGNGNGNGNEEGSFGMEKQGMSDTRFLENGKYYYDVNNKNGDVVNNKYNNNNYENEKEEEFEDGGEMEWENENENEHNDKNDEFGTEGRGGYNGKTKKLPNTYDTMEEYEKEEENRARQKYGGYVP